MQSRVVLLALFATHNIDACSPTYGDTCQWSDGDWGDFVECADGGLITGICGSGGGHDCPDPDSGDWTATNVKCEFTDAAKRLRVAGDFDDQTGLNGWQCGNWGAHLECNDNEVMVGFCGAGEHLDCKTDCVDDASVAIKCASLDTGDMVLSSTGEWLDPTQWDVNTAHTECGNGLVACGACGAGENADCDGGFARLKCCEINSFEVIGQWTYVTTLLADETFSLSYGTTKTTSEETDETWTDSCTASVAAGLEVKGDATFSGTATLSTTMSQEYATKYSETWSVSETETYTIEFDQDYEGHALWQWTFDINDPYSSSLPALSKDFAVTLSADLPPKCQPGYSANNTIDYQECTSADRTLPGY